MARVCLYPLMRIRFLERVQQAFKRLLMLLSLSLQAHTAVGIAGGADSSSVLPIGVSKKLAGSLVDLNKATNIRPAFEDFLSIALKRFDYLFPQQLLEYSTGLSMGDTAEQMAKTHGISRARARCIGAPLSHTLAAKSLGCMGYLSARSYDRARRTIRTRSFIDTR